MRRLGTAFLVLVMAVEATPQTATRTFIVNDAKKRDIVSFTSHAPLETVVGTTGEVVGYVEVDPNDISGATSGRFEVDLASLKTGIGKRDSDMKERFLETDKYPKAIFELTKVVKAGSDTLADQKPIDLMVEGTFTVHGVAQKITIPLTITFMKESDATRGELPGDLLKISGNWELLLSDYNIKRPQFLVLKLDNLQKINIDLMASTGSPAVSFDEPESE